MLNVVADKDLQLKEQYALGKPFPIIIPLPYFDIYQEKRLFLGRMPLIKHRYLSNDNYIIESNNLSQNQWAVRSVHQKTPSISKQNTSSSPPAEIISKQNQIQLPLSSSNW